MGTFRRSLDPPGFSAKGASLSDLFETAALAMVGFHYDASTVGFERELNLLTQADDLEGLLAAYLDEVLGLMTEHSFVPGDFIVVELGEPPERRFGAPLMQVRGTARGRALGDWFVPVGLPVVGVDGRPRIDAGKRAAECSVALIVTS